MLTCIYITSKKMWDKPLPLKLIYISAIEIVFDVLLAVYFIREFL